MTLTRRARKRVTPTSKIRRWIAVDGPYAVDEIRSLYGLPTVFLVVRREANGNESVVSRHRKRTAAEKTANQLTAT